MMEEKLQTRTFIPADRIESWLKGGEISLSSYPQNIVATFSEKDVSFNIIPAYKFLKLEDGQDDSEKLVGTVKTREELDRLYSDVFRDTILVGGSAYKAETGYVVEPRNGKRGSPTSINGNTCFGCLHLAIEDNSRARIYRCSRFYRVIFAAYSDSPKENTDVLLPLLKDCHEYLEDNRWYVFRNPADRVRKVSL